MLKINVLIFFVVVNLFGAKTLTPTYTLKASGSVQSIFFESNKLYSANDMGSVEIFDTSKKSLIKKIDLPLIKDFIGDKIASKIYSIDILNSAILIASQGEKGYRNIFLYKNDSLVKIIDINKKLYIKKALFVDDELILLGLLSNQVILYNIEKDIALYDVQLSSSAFSDIVLSEDKKSFIATDESGIVRVVDTKSGKITKVLKGQNVDKVYQLDYKNSVILAAGQDRRATIYSKSQTYYKQYDFLLYSCGLSPKAKLAGVAYNEDNDVIIFDVTNQNELFKLSGNQATLTQIVFINENELFTTSESKSIHFWKLK